MKRQWQAVVPFLGDKAHYSVTQVQRGIYDAHLERYEGPSGITPPADITLARGVRRWVGSYEEAYFVQELGRAIEDRIRSGHPHRQKGTKN
jgi:hypothetical protein